MDYDPDAEAVGEAVKEPVPADVSEAIRTLIRWSGDNPEREGLLEPPNVSHAPGANTAAAIPTTRPTTCPASSMKWAAMMT